MNTWIASLKAHIKRWWTAAAAALAIAFAGMFGHLPHAAPPSATLTWTAPTAYTDGTAIASGVVITYNLYQGPSGQEAATAVSTGITGLTTTITTGLVAGTTTCWQVTANANGQESAKTNEVCKTFAPEVPNPPGNLAEK